MNGVTYVRVERVCGHNDKIKSGNSKEQLIYDYNVMIGGEWRAIFVKKVHALGYEIRDIDRNPIGKMDRHGRPESQWDSEVKSKAEFDTKVVDFTNAGYIPTAEQLAAKRQARKDAAERREKLARDQWKIDRQMHAGPELYEALKLMVADYYEEMENEYSLSKADVDGDKEHHLCLHAANAALAKADVPFPTDDNQIEQALYRVDRMPV